MRGLLQRASANFKKPLAGSAWSPADDLPQGFQRYTASHTLPLSSLGTFCFAATGHYAKGTILLRRGERDDEDGVESGPTGAASPPAYDADTKPRFDGQVQVDIEARSNSDGLYSSSTLEPVEGHERCGISLTTPSGSSFGRIGASLSFHLTVTFPAGFTSLDTLSIEATHFRVLLDPSLSAIEFDNLDISTTDAPILFDDLRAKSVKLRNENRLDPNKGSLRNFDDLVSGSIAKSDHIDIACENGAVSGSYRASGPITISTTNFSIRGDYSGGSLRLSTGNGDITGVFEAKRDIIVQNAHGKIDGTWKAPMGLSIKGSYMPISGTFIVGQELRLITTVFRIDAEITILSNSSDGSSSGAAPVTRVESSATDELPTFAAAVASSQTLGAVNVLAETCDAGAELVYARVPADVVLRSSIKSTGGSAIRVKHGETFEGAFVATSPVTHSCAVVLPEGPTAGRGMRSIRYDVEKRSHVSGVVGYEGSPAEGRSRTVIESGGPAEFTFA